MEQIVGFVISGHVEFDTAKKVAEDVLEDIVQEHITAMFDLDKKEATANGIKKFKFRITEKVID